jgi:hypothetical protein
MSAQKILDYVVSDPFTSYQLASKGKTVSLAAADDIAIYPFVLPYAQKVTNICVFISGADGSHNSDIGIYDASGNLVAHIGAQLISTAGARALAVLNGPVVLQPGLYFLAFTSAATNLIWAISSDDMEYALALESTSSTSSGGALPSSISITNSLVESGDFASPYSGYPALMILT